MEEGEQEREILDARIADRRLRLKRAKNLVLPKALKPKRDGVQWRTIHAKDAGTTELDPYHRAKLRAVLSALFQQHLYPDAAGVVSVLLQAGTIADHELHRDTAYYWAAMEVLRQVDTGNSNILRYKRLYRILQRKQVNLKLRGQVQMELALYLMTLGDSASYDAAYNELRPIIDIPPFRDDPAINLCHGYTLHRLWYDRAVQEVEKHFVQDLGARPQHGADREDYEEGGGENDTIMDLQNFDENWLGSMVSGQADDLDFGLSEDMEALDVGGRHLGSQGIQRGLYEDDEEEEYELDDFWSIAVVRWTPDLDRRLFPVRLPQTRTNSLYKVPMDNGRTRDAHVNAIKCFRRAMSLATNMTPALLPLVQLLLAAGDVKGAIKEIDKCCDAPHLLPLSIKALLLESIDSKDTGPLAECYASILHINPSSSHSLKVLIDLHTSGEYKTEALVECIATHLDVEAGLLEVWQKLAACLLYLNQQWDKELAKGKPTTLGQTSGIMEEGKELVEGQSSSQNGYFTDWRENMWGDRKIWWRQKHFHEKSVDIEQQIDGDWRRIGYKAVCSIHILGLGNNYKRAVCEALATAQEDTLLDLVQAHARNSLHLNQEIWL